MLIRVAVFEGGIKDGAEGALFAAVADRLEPIQCSFPHVHDVRV